MKFCTNCGAQLIDEAIVCPNCGCAVENVSEKTESSALKTVAKIFMIIGCISSAWAFLIPLCWTIPMTVHYWKAVDNRQPVSTGFKVCSLLFVSLIAGIVMLCDKND